MNRTPCAEHNKHGSMTVRRKQTQFRGASHGTEPPSCSRSVELRLIGWRSINSDQSPQSAIPYSCSAIVGLREFFKKVCGTYARTHTRTRTRTHPYRQPDFTELDRGAVEKVIGGPAPPHRQSLCAASRLNSGSLIAVILVGERHMREA